MRVIILRTRTDDCIFVVVVILVSKVPIHPAAELDCQPNFGRLETHRVGIDQRPWCPSRIGKSTALTVILIDSIARV